VALYLVAKLKADFAFEVMAYDGVAHTATLRNDTDTYYDTNFHLGMIKRVYDLTETRPRCLKE